MEQFILFIYLIWVFIVPQIITHLGRSITHEDVDSGNLMLVVGSIIYTGMVAIFTFALIHWNILTIST